MKYFISVLTLAIFGCSSAGQRTNNTDSTLNVTDALPKLEMVTNDSVFSGHPIQFYLDHTEIPQICKDLFNGVRQPSDENDVLSLLDSVFSKNKETRPFYFLTVTRTMEKADGAYAEPLGMMGKQFVETRTQDFSRYFDNEEMLTDKELEEWAKTVAGEIQISAEGREKAELEKLRVKMKLNCDTCNEGQNEILKDFADRVAYYCP